MIDIDDDINLDDIWDEIDDIIDDIWVIFGMKLMIFNDLYVCSYMCVRYKYRWGVLC